MGQEATAVKKRNIFDSFQEGVRKGWNIFVKNVLPSIIMAYTFIYILETTGLMDLFSDIFAPVMGDRNRLRQVFVNILDNALKYSDSGDTITVLAKLEEGRFAVTVSDTGCGISREDLPMVKTRFYKGHTTRRGSGIGLAVADELIRMHKGSLELESEKDVGTTVRITLPLAGANDTKGSTKD